MLSLICNHLHDTGSSSAFVSLVVLSFFGLLSDMLIKFCGPDQYYTHDGHHTNNTYTNAPYDHAHDQVNHPSCSTDAAKKPE
jgi:hypothetical protein